MRKNLVPFLICILVSITCVLSAEAAKIKVEIGFFGVDYSITSKQGYIIPGMFSGTLGYEPKLPWEFKQVTANVYHVRMPLEKDIFLKLDAGTKQVYTVSGGTFGKESGSEKIFQNAFFIEMPPPLKPNPERLMVRLPKPVLIFDSDTNDVGIFSDGLRLMGLEEIEIVKTEEDIFHVRARGTRVLKTDDYPTFKMINIAMKTVSVASGRFGESVLGNIQNSAKVTVENGKSAALEQVVHKDLGMAELRIKKIPESAWVASEQELYHELLSKQQFDVLVVPFQVQDNAFDHIERSLMTKYLVQQIGSTTSLRIADPDIVEQALGWGYRTFSEQRIYELANALGVRKLVRIFVGHNRDMKMRLTTVIQDRPQDARFDTATQMRNFVLKDIPFSDEKLPSDVFAETLPSIMAELGIKEKRKNITKEIAGLNNVSVPLTPMTIVQSQEKSPLIQAAHLAILSAHSPAESRTSEKFLTRSLMMLRNVTLTSPDAIFLKAYAFSMLYRRPAALELLRDPSTPEQIALRSYLDGDLSALPARVEKIQSPIPKLLMQNALNDLRWSYDQQAARHFASKAQQNIPSGWNIFSAMRYSLSDQWEVPSAIDLKKYLDETYPINGYSLLDITRGMAVRGDFDSGDTVKIDLAVPEHCKRILKDHPEMMDIDWTRQGSAQDILDLAEEWAETAIVKRIKRQIFVQDLWEEGKATFDRAEVYYKGHPEFSALKYDALWSQARRKNGAESINLVKTATEQAADACIWFQGQSKSAQDVCWSTPEKFYDNDFPHREFWRRHNSSFAYGDRDEYKLRETIVTVSVTTSGVVPSPDVAKRFNAELRDQDIALRYTITGFRRLAEYYKTLAFYSMMPAADMLVERNKHRFVGDSSKTTFLARQYEKMGNEQWIPKLYEDNFLVVPELWKPYYELGSYYLRRGKTGLARETFQRYPLFRGKDERTTSASDDTVALSNVAYAAGAALHWTGAIADAIPFYKLSAGYQTGSGSGMHSEYLLSLYDGNYQRAAETALTLGRRYSNTDAYANYLRLLSIAGNVKETESLFFSLNMMDKGFIDWTPVITDLRMAGKNGAEVRSWLTSNGNGKIRRSQAQLYYLRALLVDRKPDPGLADMVENIDERVRLLEKERTPAKPKDNKQKRVTSILALFADSWSLVNLQQYDKVVSLLEKWEYYLRQEKERYDREPLLPYFAWSGAKTGKKLVVEDLLRVYELKFGRDFEYWLATAMVQSSAGKHDDALRSLDLARTNINSSLSRERPIQAWYQLVDACELLFKDTKVDAYQARALELARIYQRVQPLDSWAYAVEARFAKTEEDRLRPLALAMYLDKQSYHLEGVSKKEKERALKWLEKNNPFLKMEEEVRQEQI